MGSRVHASHGRSGEGGWYGSTAASTKPAHVADAHGDLDGRRARILSVTATMSGKEDEVLRDRVAFKVVERQRGERGCGDEDVRKTGGTGAETTVVELGSTSRRLPSDDEHVQPMRRGPQAEYR